MFLSSFSLCGWSNILYDESATTSNVGCLYLNLWYEQMGMFTHAGKFV